MNETVEYLKTFTQFPFALRRFVREALTLDGARSIVVERLRTREASFLSMVERGIYGHPRSPYLALLKIAGCELGDLRALVGDKGLEGALRSLREAGVYITFEEFKGRAPIVRGGHTIPVEPQDFDNPFARRDFTLNTGGSTGLASTVYQNLDYIAAGAPHQMLWLDAWEALDLPMLYWMPILPGGGLRFILQRAYFQKEPERWFSPTGWRDSRYWPKYDLATIYMIVCMRVLGVRVSWPTIVPLDDAATVARWMRDTIRSHGRCLLYTNTSRAVRACLAAEQEGYDLAGATIRLGGEPVTAAKVEAMRRVGVRVMPAYGAIECGAIGLGCALPAHLDDMHLFTDAFALITHPYTVEGIGVTLSAFNLTSLLDSSSKILFNYQSDDYGVVEERRCGCPLERYGFTTHVHEIRSYSKLVGEGVTLVGTEMVRILEHVLPERFGGGPLDYQLMEQEEENGLTRIYLIVSPRVRLDDEERVIDAVYEALGNSSPMGDAARATWQQARALRVKRMEPVWTARGKLLPLHIQRSRENVGQ